MQGESIQSRTFHFAVRIVQLGEQLRIQQKEYTISKQVLRSGTAIGALVREAQNAESKADFIHKLSIAQKECDETKYWIELLKAVQWIEEDTYQNLYSEATALLKIIRTIILRTKENNQSSQSQKGKKQKAQSN